MQAIPWSVRLAVSSFLVQKISSAYAKYTELLVPYARKAGQPASPSGKVKAGCLSVQGAITRGSPQPDGFGFFHTSFTCCSFPWAKSQAQHCTCHQAFLTYLATLPAPLPGPSWR